jgi:hypothetical protein
MGAIGLDLGDKHGFLPRATGAKNSWQSQKPVGMLDLRCQSTSSRNLEQILDIQGSFQ